MAQKSNTDPGKISEASGVLGTSWPEIPCQSYNRHHVDRLDPRSKHTTSCRSAPFGPPYLRPAFASRPDEGPHCRSGRHRSKHLGQLPVTARSTSHSPRAADSRSPADIYNLGTSAPTRCDRMHRYKIADSEPSGKCLAPGTLVHERHWLLSKILSSIQRHRISRFHKSSYHERKSN